MPVNLKQVQRSFAHDPNGVGAQDDNYRFELFNSREIVIFSRTEVVRLAKNIGTVTHFFDKISVAIIKLDAPLKVGDAVDIKGATTDEKMNIGSMQVDHKDIEAAEKGQEVGIKVDARIREGDKVSLAEV